MKTFRRMIRHRVVAATFFASLVFAAGGYLWAWLTLRNAGSGPLILHFDDLEGITSVGSFGALHFIGLFGIATVIVNFAIALELEERDLILGKIVAGITLLFAVLLFIAFTAIMGVN